MRAVVIVLAMMMLAPAARAAELQVWCPALVHEAMQEFAADFTRETGTKVKVNTGPMGKLVGAIQTAAPPADVVVLPPDLMESLAQHGGIQSGSRTPLARVEIGLAVPVGASRPDISTIEKLRTALLAAKAVTYSKPGPPRFSMEAKMIDSLLKRPAFSDVHALPAPEGSGVAFLAAGNADMALQVVPEILATKGINLVGPLPAGLGMHIDVAASVFARTEDAAKASAFIAYITRPDAEQVWTAQGIAREGNRPAVTHGTSY